MLVRAVTAGSQERYRVHLPGPADDLPAEAQAVQGARNRLDHDQIHQLPIHELLQRQAPQRSKPFVVQAEGVDGGEQLHHQEPQ